VRIVGLKIDRGVVAASVLQKDFRKSELVDSFSRRFATDAELVDILRDKAGEWTGATIVSSIPGHFFTQRLVHFPFSDRKRVEKALPFELEDTVPFDLNEIIVDHIVLSSGRNGRGESASKEAQVLGMMLPKSVLKHHLDLLASAGIDPQVIVPSYIGLPALARMIKAEGCTVLACGTDICLRNGEAVKGLRSFSVSSSTAGILHTLQAIEIEQKERIEKICILCLDEASQAAIAESGMAVEEVVAEFGGKRAEDPLTLGLALSEQINFRKQEFAYHVVDEAVRRKKRTVMTAAAIAGLLFLTNLGVRFYMVETTYRRLDQEIKAVYREAVPGAKAVADPVRQMRSNLDDAHRKFGALGSGSSALDIMKTVTEGVPKDVRVSFFEFNLEGDRLRLQGEAASFEAVDKIKAELQKAAAFGEVTVTDTRMGTENKVKFRMDITLKQGL
jgi:type II secretion system protein L